MTIANDPVLRELADANPVIDNCYDPAQARRVLVRAATTRPDKSADSGDHDRRRRPGRRRLGVRALLVPAASFVGVIAVVAIVVLAVHHGSGATRPQTSAAPSGRSLTLLYRVQPTPEHPTLTRAVMRRTVAILRSRARSAGVARVRVRTRGARELVVSLSGVRYARHAEQIIGSTAQLEFYDWEANVLLPDGKFVASQLPLQNKPALLISQGGIGGPGLPGTGGMALYDAVKLASQQSAQTTNINQLSRLGNEYFLFGAPGSQACAIVAKEQATVPVAGEHCYLAGPDPTIAELKSDTARPGNVAFSQGQVLKIPQGWVVLQASNPTASSTIMPTSPNAEYFVLKDDAALAGKNITNPTATTRNGHPIIQFGFTVKGATAFQQLTDQIAHRGLQVSVSNQHLFQHFAAALDGQLLTVPQIDFTHYPNGIVNTGSATAGASIQGSFTNSSARELAMQLRLEDLPVKLLLLSPHQ